MYDHPGSTSNPVPAQGEIWIVNFSPTQGHEQAGTRPAVVISPLSFNTLPGHLAIVLPMTTTQRGFPYHITVDPPEGGLKLASYVMCEQIRSVSTLRFQERWGILTPETMAHIDYAVRTILGH